MPFGEPSIPNNFIAEALHKHERRLNDLERQQYRVYYDPLNVTGDGVGRTVVEGNLLPVCGIDAFGVAIFDDSTATWRQVQGGATLPDVRSTVVGSAALNGSEFVRIDTGTFVAGSYARVIAPATPTRPGHPPPWGASIVAGANPLVFECSSNVVLALSSFPAYGDATVHLVSAAGLGTTGDVFISPTAGSIAIVTYTGISGNDLTGCTWIGPSAGWAGPAMAIHTSTQRFDTVTGPQHILVSGVNSGIFFEYEPVHNVWVRVADLSGSGGGSGVASVTAGDANIYVDNTDPLNPVV
jgi:hypothetical protein